MPCFKWSTLLAVRFVKFLLDRFYVPLLAADMHQKRILNLQFTVFLIPCPVVAISAQEQFQDLPTLRS